MTSTAATTTTSLLVSPWARRGYVSSFTQDLTSLTAFIERKWNLPAMTFRDANAHPMTDYFDFRRPGSPHPPRLAAAPPLGPGLGRCHAAGLNPPLPQSAGAARSERSQVARLLAQEWRRQPRYGSIPVGGVP